MFSNRDDPHSDEQSNRRRTQHNYTSEASLQVRRATSQLTSVSRGRGATTRKRDIVGQSSRYGGVRLRPSGLDAEGLSLGLEGRRQQRRRQGRRLRCRGVITLVARFNLEEVGAGDARLVREMDDDRAVAEEGADALFGRGVQIGVGLLEGAVLVGDDVAPLAGQVAHLTGGGLLGVARSCFAADEGVQVGERLGAVAVGRDGVDVEVVGWGC
jgi:hypothetical protein